MLLAGADTAFERGYSKKSFTGHEPEKVESKGNLQLSHISYNQLFFVLQGISSPL